MGAYEGDHWNSKKEIRAVPGIRSGGDYRILGVEWIPYYWLVCGTAHEWILKGHTVLPWYGVFFLHCARIKPDRTALVPPPRLVGIPLTDR